MKFGLFSINMGAASYPDAAVRIAKAAESAGFESVWGGEHVVLPDPQAPPSPMAPLDRALDPVVTLAFVAAATTTIRWGQGSSSCPSATRSSSPRSSASLDVLSNGRRSSVSAPATSSPSFAPLAPHSVSAAGPQTSSSRPCWRSDQDQPLFNGRFVSYAGIQSRPQPVQKPTPPIVVGGRSPAAYRRAVRSGHGWYGFAMTPEETAQAIESLQQAQSEVDRPPELGDLEISITPRPSRSGPGPELVDEFNRLGVGRLIFLPPPNADVEATERLIDQSATLMS